MSEPREHELDLHDSFYGLCEQISRQVRAEPCVLFCHPDRWSDIFYKKKDELGASVTYNAEGKAVLSIAHHGFHMEVVADAAAHYEKIRVRYR